MCPRLRYCVILLPEITQDIAEHAERLSCICFGYSQWWADTQHVSCEWSHQVYRTTIAITQITGANAGVGYVG